MIYSLASSLLFILPSFQARMMHSWSKLFIYIFLTANINGLKAQNLVPNSHFDEFTMCPFGLGDIIFASPWYSPNGKSTDFIHSCSTNGYTSIPANNWGEEFPFLGNGYAGIRVWLMPPADDIRNYREYLAVEMLDSLVKGEYYRISFQLSIGDSAKFTTDDIALAFDTTRFPNEFVLMNEIAIENEEGNIILTDEGWYKISGQYKAKGGERHLAIGNFKDDTNTTLVSRGLDEGTESCYFYIDEVIVEPCKGKFPERLLQITDTTICPGSTLDLKAASIPNALYEWEGIPTDSIYTISEPGIYQLMVEVDDCLRQDSIEITEADLPVFDLGADTTICPGETLLLTLDDSLGQIVWHDQSQTASIWISDEGIYSATATLGKCSFSDSIEVEVLPLYEPKPSIDTLICEGLEVVFAASAVGSSYNWQDQSNNPTFSAILPGEYWVDIQTSCFLEREYFSLRTRDCGCELFMPNVFTPNGDGINEAFQPKLKDGISNFKLNIYDRWGRVMFQTNDPFSLWDGSYKKDQAPIGVYFWQIQYDCISEMMRDRVLLEGHVSLLR